MINVNDLNDTVFTFEDQNKTNILIIIMYTIIFISFILICFLKYEFYYQNNAIIIMEENKYYLKMNVDIVDIEKISNNNTIVINNTEYKYKTVIKENTYVDQNYTSYKEILIDTNLKQEEKILNNVLKIKIKYKEKTILKNIITFLKGE